MPALPDLTRVFPLWVMVRPLQSQATWEAGVPIAAGVSIPPQPAMLKTSFPLSRLPRYKVVTPAARKHSNQIFRLLMPTSKAGLERIH